MSNPFNNMPKLGVTQADPGERRNSNAPSQNIDSGFGNNSILKGPSAAAFDELKNQVEDMLFRLKSQETKS